MPLTHPCSRLLLAGPWGLKGALLAWIARCWWTAIPWTKTCWPTTDSSHGQCVQPKEDEIGDHERTHYGCVQDKEKDKQPSVLPRWPRQIA